MRRDSEKSDIHLFARAGNRNQVVRAADGDACHYTTAPTSRVIKCDTFENGQDLMKIFWQNKKPTILGHMYCNLVFNRSLVAEALSLERAEETTGGAKIPQKLCGHRDMGER